MKCNNSLSVVFFCRCLFCARRYRLFLCFWYIIETYKFIISFVFSGSVDSLFPCLLLFWIIQPFYLFIILRKHLYHETFSTTYMNKKFNISLQKKEKHSKWQGLSMQSKGIGMKKVIYILCYHAVFDLNIFWKFKSLSRALLMEFLSVSKCLHWLHNEDIFLKLQPISYFIGRDLRQRQNLHYPYVFKKSFHAYYICFYGWKRQNLIDDNYHRHGGLWDCRKGFLNLLFLLSRHFILVFSSSSSPFLATKSSKKSIGSFSLSLN